MLPQRMPLLKLYCAFINKKRPQYCLHIQHESNPHNLQSLQFFSNIILTYMKTYSNIIAAIVFLLTACNLVEQHDLIIRNALIFDGTGKPPVAGDLAISGDTIAAIGDLSALKAKSEIDAKGLALSPGFVNMLSWANESLIQDGRAQSDLRQGVTLVVMGEGSSMGPYNKKMKKQEMAEQGDIKFDITWNTLGEYLEFLEQKGVAVNVASFVGATTLRVHEVGFENRPPTATELENMKNLARQAMEEGALGIGSSLIYAPAFYAGTDELIELCQAVAPYGGMYISHLRSEGNKFFEAVEELITIAKEANVAAEIYHLKAAGKNNWPKMDSVIRRIERARAEGIDITTDMYNYIAGATGLDAAMPPWVQEGGYEAWAKRLQDPETRKKVAKEMAQDAKDWENLYYAAGSAEKVILVGFKNDSLKQYTGKTLAELAALRGNSPEETAMDLVVKDSSRVGTVYFLMSEDNVKRQIALPYMTFGSDAGAPSAEGVFLKSNPHPRAYGNFARLLGKYVRDEKVISLEEAIHRLTQLSAERLKIKKRGLLKPGYFADLVLFDPNSIQDHATFDKPHQYATGVHHVWVNGVQVLRSGEPTNAKAGRFVRGPGWTGWRK